MLPNSPYGTDRSTKSRKKSTKELRINTNEYNNNSFQNKNIPNTTRENKTTLAFGSFKQNVLKKSSTSHHDIFC